MVAEIRQTAKEEGIRVEESGFADLNEAEKAKNKEKKDKVGLKTVVGNIIQNLIEFTEKKNKKESKLRSELKQIELRIEELTLKAQ